MSEFSQLLKEHTRNALIMSAFIVAGGFVGDEAGKQAARPYATADHMEQEAPSVNDASKVHKQDIVLMMRVGAVMGGVFILGLSRPSRENRQGGREAARPNSEVQI